jgi:hypothetical protein
MHSQIASVSISSIAQPTKETKDKPNEIRLGYDRSVRLYVRAQAVGVPVNGFNELLFEDQFPLESSGVIDFFFYKEVTRNTLCINLLNRVRRENGPCVFASLDETVAFLAHRDRFGFKRVVCVNSGVFPLGCVTAKLVSFKAGFNEESYLMFPRVPSINDGVIFKGNIVLFKKRRVETS